MIKTLKQHQFLFRELVKRDFRQKYKKTTLGVIWSILNPLAEFLVLMLIFKQKHPALYHLHARWYLKLYLFQQCNAYWYAIFSE